MKKVLILANNASGLYLFRKETPLKLQEAYDVTIALPEEPAAQKLLDLGLKLRYVKINRRGTNPIADFKLMLRFRKLIREIKPDMVLTYTVKCNIYGGIACRLTKTPYAATMTGLGSGLSCGGFLQRLTEWLYRVGLKKCNVVFFQNAENEAFFTERRLTRAASQLLPGSGVNLEEHPETPYPDEENGIRLLFLGRLMREKGLAELLEAARRLHEAYPQVSVHMAGMVEEQAWKDQIEAYSAIGAVVYHGSVPDVRPLIADCHAALMPSYHEGMCNALMESASMGRALLATDIPGCRETVEEGVNGFLFPPRSADSLVEAAERFLALSREEREAMGKMSRAKMEREFDRKCVTAAYVNAVKEHQKA